MIPAEVDEMLGGGSEVVRLAQAIETCDPRNELEPAELADRLVVLGVTPDRDRLERRITALEAYMEEALFEVSRWFEGDGDSSAKLLRIQNLLGRVRQAWD